MQCTELAREQERSLSANMVNGKPNEKSVHWNRTCFINGINKILCGLFFKAWNRKEFIFGEGENIVVCTNESLFH